MECSPNSSNPAGQSLSPLTRSHFFLLFLWRSSFLVLPLLPFFTVENTLSFLRSFSDFSLFRQGATLVQFDSLSPHDLVICTDGSVSFPFGKSGCGVLANCSFYETESTFFSSAGSVASGFSAKACPILHALRWSQQHQQVCRPFLFPSPSLRLSLYPRRFLLPSIFLFTLNTLADLAGTVFSFLLYSPVTMGLRTLISPGKIRG